MSRKILYAVTFLVITVILSIEHSIASIDLERLLDWEGEIHGAIDRYVAETMKRMDGLKRLKLPIAAHTVPVHALKTTTSSSMQTTEPFFTTRLIIQPFRLSRKMNQTRSNYDALSLFKLINGLVEVKTLIETNLDVKGFRRASDEDLLDAANALFRLQDTYALNTSDLASGKITGFKCSHQQFTARDCFDLGKMAIDFDPPDHYHALLWLLEAEERISLENEKTMNETLLLYHLSMALFHQGNLERAVLSAIRLQQMDPHYPGVEEHVELFTKELQKKNTKLKEDSLPPLRLERQWDWRFPDEDIYESLCRGEMTPLVTEPPLSCYYKRDTPYLNLAPFKSETLHHYPLIIVFRNAISKMEAQTMRKLAETKMSQSEISTTSTANLSKYRTSRTAWLADDSDPVIASISRRVEDISGLTCNTAEKFQVAKYDLGGHYMPHFDFAGDDRKHQFANLGTGDRIATVLFYLSNTTAGGATVFPKLRLTVRPQEFDALMWYNLHRNGEGDLRTRHAACPVLVGEKWIANKWLHEFGQEFTRPCALEESS